jgi:MerR family transcriptional regulator/heat shock protein HspR
VDISIATAAIESLYYINLDTIRSKVYTHSDESERRQGMYDREPLYVISVAARLLDMHAQTLRKYEREQFIKPSRTQGRLRLYSAEDIERLRQIKHLVEYVGLNLAGVQLALGMTQRLDALREGVREAESREAAVELVEREIQTLLAALGVPQEQEQPPARRTEPRPEPPQNGRAGQQESDNGVPARAAARRADW